MSEGVDYQQAWQDEKTQCRHCRSFQTKEGENACVPPGKSFEEALKDYGEANPAGHCNYFEKK